MVHNAIRFSIGIIFLIAFLAPAPAQEFYKKPETTAEFWRYMNHEIELGQYKVAAGYLKGFIAKNPSDEELLQMQEKEGSSAFLRLLTIPELKAEAKPLVERVDALVRKHLSDRKRLDALIQLLNESQQERAYAIAQLKRSGADAMPALIDALERSSNDLDMHAAILGVLPLLDKSTVPPLLAALDTNDAALRSELIDVIRKRAEKDATPYLWYLSASPKQPDALRKKASATLAAFLGLRANSLPSAKTALTQEAEKYYQHRVAFLPPDRPVIWQWDGKQLVSQTVTPSQAEEHYGLRFAREALELDPTYRPAQVIFLSIALDKGVERAGLDQPLAKGALPLRELLTSVNPGLVIAVLDKALQEHRLPVILATVRGLGELANVQATRSSGRALPVLVRALHYPDRRVQMGAVDAQLRIPVQPEPLASARVVDILRRLVMADPVSKVLVADFNLDRANMIASGVKTAGFEPVVVRTGKQALAALAQSGDFDAVLVNADIPDPMLPGLVGQLRADVNSGLLPLLIMTMPDRVGPLERQLERYPNTYVVPISDDSRDLKNVLSARISEAMGKPLTEAERKDYAARSIEWLARLARGEVPGYDIQPAAGAILKALHVKELAGLAVEAAGRLRGREPQSALATLVLDANQPEGLRSAASIELCRHIEQFGLLLTSAQAKALGELYAGLPDSKLKANVSLVIGTLRPDARQTGERLQQFNPGLASPAKPEPAPAPPKGEKGNPSGLSG